MGATINCGIGWRTAISMWRWRISPACRPAWSWWIFIRNVWCWSSRTRCDWISPAAGPPSAPDETAIGAGDLSSLERCPFLLGNPQDIDGRIGDMLFRRAGFAPVAAGREPHTRSASAYPPATTGGARSMISSTARAGASAPLTGMIPAGTVGSRLIVVEHGLDVVAVGIMDERGIVARPVVRARTGLAVVGAAGRETRLMERLDGVGGLGAERDV